jgi:4-hydroxythreonine-4-phosphate dehydrogenase
METKPVRVGITVGDINSIGIEVIIKTLNDHMVFSNSIPVIYGSSKTFSFHKKALNQNEFNYLVIKDATEAKPKKINLINVWDEEVNIVLGEKNANGGKYALKSLEAAVADLKSNRIDVLVTAPINKDCVREAGFEFPGHTEYLAHISEAKDVLMLMVAGDLRVGVVTGHVPLKEVPALITKDRIEHKLRLLLSTLRKDFMINKPRIAVLGSESTCW